MKALLLLSFLSVCAGAATPAKKADIELAEYMLKVELSEASPSAVGPFLALDPEGLPKRLRRGVRARQLEVRGYVKLHQTKKKGGILQPAEDCGPNSYIKPTRDLPLYQQAGWTEEITEAEEDQVMEYTRCQEPDLGCLFTMMVFKDAGSKVPRRLFFMGSDPIIMLVVSSRKKTLGGNYFGTGLSCLR